jgi:P4 family phage/plasmid primase-like protien
MDTNNSGGLIDFGQTGLSPAGAYDSGITLGSLAGQPRWCAWTKLARRGGTELTKVPFGAGYARARSNDPATWLTLAEVPAVAYSIHADTSLGVFLGALGYGSGLVLCGIDLDLCLDANKAPLPWAAEILTVLHTGYCETSPSGEGLKLFVLVRETDLAAVRDAVGMAPGSDGRQWKQPVEAGVKAAGIEAYVGRRWFAVTTLPARLGEARMGVTGPAEWRALADIAQRRFGGRRQSRSAVADASLVEPVVCRAIGDAEQRALDAAFLGDDKLSALWTGEDAARDRWLGADKSDSTLMFVLAVVLREKGVERDVAATALMQCCEALAGFWEKHAWDAERQFARAWAKGGKRVDQTGPVEFLPVPVAGPAASPDPVVPSGPRGTSDDAVARWMIERHGRDLRFDAQTGQWFKWNGSRWLLSSRTEVTGIARKVCKAVAFLPSTKPEQAGALLALKKIKAVEEMARNDDDVQIRFDQWDCDPWLLNTPGGVVDLKTGELLPHDRNYHMRKMAAVTPDFSGLPTRWLGFMDEITIGNGLLAGFLQRVAGYCLTGITREHDMFFFYGGGRNGKGTFLNTLLHLLGLRDYAKVADQDTFTASKYGKHSTDLASMAGCRMVVVPETEEGAEWDERRVKSVTGGDPITARFMRQDNFTFDPQFKLIVSGNNKPTIKVVDTAIRSRMNLAPFMAVFQGAREDKLLAEKLSAEHPRILAWAIQGCLEWQRSGMQKPEIVKAATAQYLDAEDTKQAWFGECCAITDKQDTAGKPHKSRQTVLYQSWKTWIEADGGKAGTKKDLVAWFDKQGFVSSINFLGQLCVERVELTNRH